MPKKKPDESNNIPPLYPFYLPPSRAKELVKNFASEEFEHAKRFHSPFADYSYSAEVRENGDVELFVHYSSDDGVVLSSGAALKKVVQPFSKKKLAELKAQRMFAIAEAEYIRRQREQDLREIEKIHVELFGAKLKAVSQ